MADAGRGIGVLIAGRGVAVSPALRRRVELKVAKVGRLLPKITEARVVLALERYRHLAEVTLHAKGAALHAEGAAGDFHAAVELALEGLEQQVRRRKDRIRERKPRAPGRPAAAPKRGAASGSGEGADAPGLPGTPRVEVRRAGAKPMSVDEALDQMRLRRDPLLVFTNARTGVVNVLHRRPDGVLELVEPAG